MSYIPDFTDYSIHTVARHLFILKEDYEMYKAGTIFDVGFNFNNEVTQWSDSWLNDPETTLEDKLEFDKNADGLGFTELIWGLIERSDHVGELEVGD